MTDEPTLPGIHPAPTELHEAILAINPILLFFRYAHLPATLQRQSKLFHDLAFALAASLPPSAELTMALRKLLEAKDCAVRAAL